VTEYSYQNEWKEPSLNIQAMIFGSVNRNVTGCEKFIWKKWFATKLERNFWAHCNKPAAFWDLALRSVHPNVSTTFQTKKYFSNPGYSGSFSQKFFYRTNRLGAWEASISMFHGFATCGILYCDCLRRSETTSLVTWSVGFSKYDSANILCLTLLITAILCIRKYLYSKPGGLMSYIGLFINVLGILLRQGSYKGFLLTAFSLWTYSVSLLFENALMSGLVVPNRNPVLDLAELTNAGYRILFHGGMNEFGSHFPYLRDEFHKFGVTYNKSLVKTSNASIANNPRTFAIDKFSSFIISTTAGKKFLQEDLKSSVAEHCDCFETRNQFTKFPVYSFFHHKLFRRIFRSVQILTQGGLHTFFDWDLQRPAPDFRLAPKKTEDLQTSFDSFVSLNNLAPMLVVSLCLLLMSSVFFVIENTKIF
jgi:hypothetical protein